MQGRAPSDDHLTVNQAIINSVEQEMLLNLVRLRYRDSASFLRIGSVTASLSIGSSAGVDANFVSGSGNNSFSPDIGISYSDEPTISYVPLQGEEFLKSVLTPISLEAVLVMIQSGWSVERVFGITVERLNDLYNSPTASGPTPTDEPEYKDFKHMLSLFREFQLKGDLEIGPDLDIQTKQTDLIMLFESDKVDTATLRELGDMLRGSRPGSSERDVKTDRVRISTNFLQQSGDEIIVRTRSISSVLFYLSQNLQIPEEHEQAGLVTVTTNDQGNPFDWSQTPAGGVFQVRSAREKPTNTALAVPYRGYWFYIADNDLQSKSTFLLLMQLFNLQAGQNETRGPTLTIPVK